VRLSVSHTCCCSTASPPPRSNTEGRSPPAWRLVGGGRGPARRDLSLSRRRAGVRPYY
jgi:hypothetical protein